MSSKKLKERRKVTHKHLFTDEQIAKRIHELGKQISAEYNGEPLMVVGVLKGSFIFVADLVRALNIPVTIDFIGVASYEGTQSTGHVRITNDLATEIQGRHVLLVEDIVDTGRTIDYLLDSLRLRQPKSLKVCAFLSKPEAHVMHSTIDYVGFEISKEFVIGYGLDLDQYYREMPYVAQVTEA